MEANLRKCLITTRQSLFCALIFDAADEIMSDWKIFSKVKNDNYVRKKYKCVNAIILKSVRLQYNY
jgi:hypothetical protein